MFGAYCGVGAAEVDAEWDGEHGLCVVAGDHVVAGYDGPGDGGAGDVG